MSTTITWPTDLPQQFLVEGYADPPQDNLIRTQMDAAQANQRPRFTNVADDIKGTMLMTEAQYTSFKTFFKSTLKNGAYSFLLPVKGDNATYHEVRFKIPYDPQSQAPFTRVSMQLETIV